MPILMTGCFDDSDEFIIERYKIRGFYVYQDGVDPRWKNNDNVMAVLHSDMLLKEHNTRWSNTHPLRIIVSTNHWKERAVNLMTDMDEKSDNRDWLWKDTRLMLTASQWDMAVNRFAPERDMTYLVCYQHPISAIHSMKRLRKNHVPVLKTFNESQLYDLYSTYYLSLLEWVNRDNKANVIGISLDSPEYITTLEIDPIYEMMKETFSE